LKNQKVIWFDPASVGDWLRLQYEQNNEKGLQLYFTPLKGTTDSHILPIGVRWNPRQSVTVPRSHYEHFLLESPSMQDARSCCDERRPSAASNGLQGLLRDSLNRGLRGLMPYLRRYTGGLFSVCSQSC